MQHLVFYDGTCGLCDHMVQFLLKIDTKRVFAFAPLQGETAKELLKDLPVRFKSADSMVLIENYQTQDRGFFVLSKAVFRICWLLGGVWCLLGGAGLLPSFIFDSLYALVAKNRHRFFSSICILPDPSYQDRFLS